MSNPVYANGRLVSCRQAAGKTIAAFPDVCFTPPDTIAATPQGTPVPYPNTARAADLSNGSKNVKIGGKAVMLKNRSFFNRSTGNEAGRAGRKGLLSCTHQGKAYFVMWSMNVRFEGLNAVRHLDLTTHNHRSTMPGNTPPWPYLDTAG